MSGSQQLLLGGSVQQAVDPYFYSVTSLLHGDGTNGGQNNTFLDSSTNNFTITRNGNTTQGSFSPFSQTGWSNFNPDSNNGIGVATNAALNMGTGDFTVEAWINTVKLPTTNAFQTSSGGYQCVFGTGPNNSASGSQLYIGVTNLFFDISTDGGGPINVAHGMSPGQWYHVAITRSGNTFRAFINGTLVQTATSSASWVDGYAYGIMRAEPIGGYNGAWWYGYVSNFRVVKGTAVYTASFTPSITPLTAISGTSLLTCQSNRFIDNSTNAFTISVNNSPSVQPFSPFNPTTAYSTSAVGGSGYFDGSGDYLQVADAAAMELGSGNWTIEMWVNTTNSTAYSALFSRDDGSVTAGSYVILLNGATANGIVSFYSADINSFTAAVLTSGSVNCRDGAWHHIAVVRNGNTLTMYIDGTSTSTASFSGSFGNTAQPLKIGSETGYSRDYTGYMSSVRLVVGSAVYTSNFTPPTAPLASITNTQLLLNFTNGAIFDNAAVADYETVGNAQISTSVKKYGTGSLAFDGTGDYLVTDAPSTQLMTFGTGDFTIEFWLYVAAFPSAGAYKIIYDSRPNSTQGLYPTITLKGSTIVYYTNSADRIASGSISATTWYHVALCRTASQTKLFINGTQVGSTYADTNSYINVASRPLIGDSGFIPGSTDGLNGYIDDLRVSKGVARYPYNFTPPTAEFPNIGGTVTLTADPYFENTTLLLPGNGTNGAQNNTFLDSSSNAFTITRNGNTTQGTFSPFSQTGWGNFFDGSGDYLTAPSNAAFDFGTGDFTLEVWGYRTSSGAYGFLISRRAADVNYGPFSLGLDGSNAPYFACSSSGSSWIFVLTGSALPLNSWFHLAGVRNGNTFALYVNGTSVGTATSSASLMASSVAACIGAHANGSEPFAGYISNARIVKGTAVYTANFTPPTAPLTAITNTSLLTCQSNRFIDNSANAFAITRNGDVSVQAFSPFNPTASWSAATNGGSGYFDGSGDYLTVADNAALELGSSNFCIELFYFPTSVAGSRVLIGKRTTPATDYGFVIFASGATLQIYISSGNSSYDISNGVSIGTLVTNQWHHIAVYRVGNAWYGSFNGVITTLNASNSSAVWDNSAPWAIGAESNATSPIVGYMSDVRFVIGSSVYTGSSAPVPTAPLTAITNTSLLLNFTNAGIYDATSKNDLETVGNAQISTTQSKFGGSSMYFDGNGDYLKAISTDLLNFGTGDFTIEFWSYFNSTADSGGLGMGVITNPTGTYSTIYSSTNGGTTLTFYNGSGIVSGTIALSTWQHIAVSRYNGTVRFFVNGIQTASATHTSAVTFSAAFIGSQTASGGYFNGYLDDLRVTKGIARYTSNFTPPTTAFLTQ